MTNPTSTVEPDYVTPPGDTLRETIDTIGMSQSELAQRTGRSPKLINQIIRGKAALSHETALELERVLGVPASLWNNIESAYQEHRARTAEESRLATQNSWLEEFRVQLMADWKWIAPRANTVDQLREVLNFFGVASPDEWDTVWQERLAAAQYRQSTKQHIEPKAVAAWLRQGELEGRRIECQEYDPSAFRSALEGVRRLTDADPEEFVPRLTETCAQCGVAVVFVPELPNTGMIRLSLRYKSNDQLWFTFFHEAGHVYMHGKSEQYVDMAGESAMRNVKEDEANKFAADRLIPEKDFRAFVENVGRFDETSIIRFAEDVGIAPGVVVGRLQRHDFVPWRSRCNRLKRRFRWVTN